MLIIARLEPIGGVLAEDGDVRGMGAVAHRERAARALCVCGIANGRVRTEPNIGEVELAASTQVGYRSRKARRGIELQGAGSGLRELDILSNETREFDAPRTADHC